MSRLTRLWESFWFLPALLCLLAAVLAEGLVTLDEQVLGSDAGLFDVLFYRVGASGSRDLLGAIAGSMLAVASTTFSITIAVLALSSSTYGPRLVRNFMTDRGNQLVLGVFLSTFLYALMVLRSVRTEDDNGDGFVPHVATNVAVLLAVVAIGVLVYFIHHISDSIQVATLARRVRDELRSCVEQMYPAQAGAGVEDTSRAAGQADLPAGLERDGVVVRAPHPGYVQGVDEEGLLQLATERDLVVLLRVRPGAYVVGGSEVAVLWPPDRVDDEAGDALVATLHVTDARTPRQDIEFAVQQLVEMAVRALSPSTNDPYTAINALDDLSSGLVLLATRATPSPQRYDDDEHLRIVSSRPTLEDLLDQVFDAMRLYAVEHPSVLHRTLELGERVGGASSDPRVHERLRLNVRVLVDAYSRSDPQQHDLDLLRRRAARLTATSP